jgi:hypothetical protein
MGIPLLRLNLLGESDEYRLTGQIDAETCGPAIEGEHLVVGDGGDGARRSVEIQIAAESARVSPQQSHPMR